MIEPGTYEDFLHRYSDLLDSLASVGWTPNEAYTRFTTLYPEAQPEYILRAFKSGRWTFVGRKEHLLNHTMMASALWYSVAVTYDLDPDPTYTAVTLDPVIMQDVPRLFDAAGVKADRIATIMGKIGAAVRYLAENPYTRLEEASYDDFLEDLPAEAVGITDDVMSWPPSRFLIEDRLGDGNWSQALLRVGVCPPDLEELGLSLSGSALSDRAFRNALGEFLSYCIRYDRKPTVLLYGSWTVAQSQLGRVPLLGAIRSKYGSWYRALKLGRRMVNDALKMSVASAVPARSSSPTVSPGATRIDELNAHGIGVVETPRFEARELRERAWVELRSVLQARLQELPWSQSLRVYYISPRVVETEDYTPYVRIMRSPAGYLCEITAADEFVAATPDYDTDYLLEQGWFEPRKTGYHAWSQNFFDVSNAAATLVDAMRWGLGCDRPDYFQSDDPAHHLESDAANPSTGSVPMIPVQPSITTVEFDD